MADIKLMVMYPCPHDIRAFEKLFEDKDMPMCDGLSSEYAMSFEAFEKLYHEEHVPMIVEKLVGKTRFVATKVVARERPYTGGFLPGSAALRRGRLIAGPFLRCVHALDHPGRLPGTLKCDCRA